MNRIAVSILCLSMCACATTQQYVPVADQNNLAPGNALIKVERRDDFMGSGRSIELSDNGKIIGKVSPGKFLSWQRPAENFTLQLVPAALAVSNPVPINVSAKKGKQYNFEVFWGGSTFELKEK